MRPTTLELQNFTAYADEHVDLSGLSLAAITGANGSGKSSLLDALCYALFGEATKGGTKALDNYVRGDEPECRVAVEFALGGHAWRVVRHRSRAKQRTMLELYRRDGGGWVPSSGRNVSDTQEAIERLLRMDYRTFTASSLILQGRADSFTADMTDAERKEALARILGLDLWDDLQERARDRARDARAEARALTDQAGALQATVAERQRVEGDLRRAEATAAAAEQEAQRIAAQVAEIEAQTAQWPSLTQRAKALASQIARARSEQDQATAALDRAKQAIEETRGLLSQREAAQAAHDQAEAIGADLAVMDQEAAEAQRLDGEVRAAEQRAARWDAERQAQVARLEASIGAKGRQGALLGEVPCAGTELAVRCQLLAHARQAAAQAVEEQGALAEVHGAVNPHTAAHQAALESRAAIRYDPRAHQAARAAWQELQITARLLPAIEAAGQRMADLTAEVERQSARWVDLEQHIQAWKTECAEVQGQLAAMSSASRLVALREELANEQRTARDAQQTVGRLRQQLAEVERAAEALVSLGGRVAEAQERAEVYSVLDEACGKRGGVPALIVENAVPAIEALGNDLLGRMSEGRFSLRLDTQAETKAGTTAEVLRITVMDRGSERPYVTFSGAERFQVDVALRVALGKFLAHRSGAEIGLLVLDEGASCLDEAGRGRFLSVLETLRGDFPLVLAVTHLADLRDAFPQRVEVDPGPDGSRVRVVA